jgi:cytochrome c551/c552
MRRAPALALFAALALAGCRGAKVVSPVPETVIGPVPKETTAPTTSTTAGPTGGTGTQTGGGGSGGSASGKALFASNGCGSCHTYKPAGSTGKVGPDLDKLPGYAKTAGKPLDTFVEESIVHPKAYIEKGYPPVMPSFVTLSKPQVDALVKFLTTGS